MLLSSFLLIGCPSQTSVLIARAVSETAILEISHISGVIWGKGRAFRAVWSLSLWLTGIIFHALTSLFQILTMLHTNIHHLLRNKTFFKSTIFKKHLCYISHKHACTEHAIQIWRYILQHHLVFPLLHPWHQPLGSKGIFTFHFPVPVHLLFSENDELNDHL